jgi:hypothetical protein
MLFMFSNYSQVDVHRLDRRQIDAFGPHLFFEADLEHWDCFLKGQ